MELDSLRGKVPTEAKGRLKSVVVKKVSNKTNKPVSGTKPLIKRSRSEEE